MSTDKAEQPTFTKGDRVQLTTVENPEFRGRLGTIKRVYRTSKELLVLCDNGRTYRAYRENVRHYQD